MDRYSIILKKTPSPATPSPALAQSENILDQIRRTILAGTFPYKVEDAVVRFYREDPNWIEVEVLIRPIYPAYHININFIVTGSDEGYHPTFEINLREAVFNRLNSNIPSFYDISLIPPMDCPSPPQGRTQQE